MEATADMMVRDQQTQAEFDASAQRMEGFGWAIVGVAVAVLLVKAIRNERSG